MEASIDDDQSGQEHKSLSDTDKIRVSWCRSPRFGSSRGGPTSGRKFGNPGERLRKKRWDLEELPKFEKNFYSEHVEVQRMSQVPLMIMMQISLLTCYSGLSKAFTNCLLLLLLCVFSLKLMSITVKRKSPFEARAARNPSSNSIRLISPVINTAGTTQQHFLSRFFTHNMILSSSRVRNGCTDGTKLQGAHPHSGSRFPSGPQWKRHGGHCSNWLWEDLIGESYGLFSSSQKADTVEMTLQHN